MTQNTDVTTPTAVPGGDRAVVEAQAQQQAIADVDRLLTHPFQHHPRRISQTAGDSEFTEQAAALARIAQALGRDITPPSPQQTQRADLRLYAQNAGLILRDVELPDRWWRRDFGPLLVSTDMSAAAALIPRRGRYHLIEADGSETTMRADNANRVTRSARSVVPQLPEPITNPWQIGRYGLSGNIRWMLLATVISLIAGLVTLTVPLATKAIWDRAVPELDYSLVWGILAFLLAASFAGMALKIIEKFASLRVGSRYRAFVTPAIWFRLQRIQSSYFRTNPIGVVSQQAGLVPGLFKLTVDPLFSLIGFVGFGIPSLVLMFWLAPSLAWVAIVAVLVEIVVSILISWRSAQLVQRQFPLGSAVTSTLHGLIAGLPALRIAGAEAFGLQQWGERFSKHQRLTVQVKYLEMAASVFGLTWPIIVTIGIYAVTGTSLLGAISVGTFLAFMTTFGFFKSAARKLPKTVAVFFGLSKVWNRCSPVFQAPLERPLDAIDPGELTGQVALDGVDFSYSEGQNVLTDVSVNIDAGSFVALVGPSGAGKSTIARLLVGLENPTRGTVSYNHTDFARLDVEVVRAQLGVVLQGMRPYGETIRDVVDGDRGLDDDTLWKALTFADLATQVRDLPMGLDTYMGAAGEAFSGGEVQRLLVARAVAGDPRMLILDEATSAFDDITQQQVMDSVSQLPITRVVIAQRLSTIVDADVIHVVDAGRIVESGSYSDLVAAGGQFAAMVAAQGNPRSPESPARRHES